MTAIALIAVYVLPTLAAYAITEYAKAHPAP